MAGFATQADLISEMTVACKVKRADWQKQALPTTAQVAGNWYDLTCGTGTPGPDTLFGTGTNLAFQALTDVTTGNVGIKHGGNVTPDLKFLMEAQAFSAAATTMPCVLMLIDILGYYPITTVTTTGDQALNNTTPFPAGRHTNGQGLCAYVVASSGAATTPMGAATPNIRMTYTNQANTAGQLTPADLPVGNTAAPKGQIVYGGPAGVGKYGPFMPLAPGDWGIRSVQQFNLSASYLSGVLNLVICRPLALVPLSTVGVVIERDFLNQIPSMPRIYDGAHLSWLMYAGAATPVSAAFFGKLQFVWG